MGTFFTIFTGVIVTWFAFAPLLSLYRQTIKARPRFTPIDLTHLPGVQLEQIQHVVETLQREGFMPETYQRLMDGSVRFFRYFILLANRTDRSVALVTITVPQPIAGKPPVPGDVEVTFLTRFTEGMVVETHNSRKIAYTPTLPNEIRTFLPSIRDIHRLYQMHCYTISEHNLHIRDGKLMHDEGTAVEFLTELMEKCCTGQEEHGYLRLDPTSREPLYRPTWKGAYLMTWNNMFPVTLGRWVVRQIREREALAEFRRSPWGVALMR